MENYEKPRFDWLEFHFNFCCMAGIVNAFEARAPAFNVACEEKRVCDPWIAKYATFSAFNKVRRGAVIRKPTRIVDLYPVFKDCNMSLSISFAETCLSSSANLIYTRP